MQRRFRPLRRRFAVAAVVAAVPVLSGCSSNFDSPVLQPYNPGIGVYEKAGSVAAFNVVIVADGEGSGTLVATLINQGQQPDRLVGVEVQAEGNRQVMAELVEPVELLPEQPVQVHETQAVTFSGRGLRPGFFVTLTLQFERGADIDFKVPTETTEDPYEDIQVP